MRKKEIWDLIFRYGILILLGTGSLWLFYKIFTPLTIYPAAWILNIFFEAHVIEDTTTIFFNDIYVSIISACVAGSAYYLLLIFNLTTPMKKISRIKSIVTLLGIFLILNIARIVIFAMLFSVGYKYFDLAHSLTWIIGSTIMVVAIWFGNVWLFGIKEIPIYSDARMIIKSIKKTKAG